MSDQIQETQQVEVQQTQAPQTEAPAPKKDNWFLKLWRNKNKRNVFMLACCLVLILLATMVGSLVQTAGWSAKVEDLRNETNRGSISLTPVDDGEDAVAKDYTVTGSVVSGILYTPKKASAEHPAPAVVFTHGLYNNREMQLQNAIEMVRRGYVVLVIDRGQHGHNYTEDSYMTYGKPMVDAAKYLYNLPYVAKDKIAVSGHSMGGMATTSALTMDGRVTGKRTDANFKAGNNMGIISAGLVQANNPTDNKNIGENVVAVGVVKASSDEFFFSSNLKEETYVPVNKDSVTELNYTNYYLKVKDEYVKQTSEDKFRPNKQYYNLTKTGNSTYYLQSSQAVTFTGRNPAELEDWTTVNGGIYVNGALVAEPNGKKLASVERKGEAIGAVENSLRVVYEARETHPMNHFSVKTAANVIDFFYNAFGVTEGYRYMAPTNQTWWLKEAFALLGFLGLFGMLFPVLDLLLGTRLFASVKGEVSEAPLLLKKPRKHVTYWLSGILTAWFGAYSLQHAGEWSTLTGFSKLFQASEGYIYANVGTIAFWGICCAAFALVVSGVIWVINRCINVFVYGDDFASYDEHPFDGFKIRSWQNVLKTPLLALLLVGIFYGVVQLLWSWTVVDFRIWTFDIRVFDTVKIVSMLKYVPLFFVFYMISAAMSQNFRVKDLPEWATIAINVFFNVIGIIILLWNQNSYFINTGALIDGANKLFFIACYPIIPCVAIATVVARRMYTRTGNAWLAGLVNALIMTFIACANTSVSGAVSWFYGA